MSEVKKISFAQLNATKICENTHEFNYVNEDGDETSLVFTIIGDQAESVKKAIYKKINQERQQEAILKKRGKDAPIKTIEELIEDNVEGIAACIVGWKGVEDMPEYSPELAITLCQNNKLIFDQVKAASENLANFSKSK